MQAGCSQTFFEASFIQKRKKKKEWYLIRKETLLFITIDWEDYMNRVRDQDN